MERKLILAIEENNAVCVAPDIVKGTVGLAVESAQLGFVGLSFTPQNAKQLVQALQEAIKEIEKGGGNGRNCQS